MGNEKSLHSKIEIQTQPYFACGQYSLHNCHDIDLKPFTLFVFNGNESYFNANHWKSIRHPYVVKYYDNGTFRGRKCVVTEPVTALIDVINNLTSDELISGIHNICEALSFIHDKCKLSHNCLSLDAIFVSSSTHTWKLGALQFATQVGEETSDSLKELRNFKRNNNIPLPPEDANGIKPITKDANIHSRDAFSLGAIIEQLLNSDQQISDDMRNLSNKNPDQRVKISSLLEDEIFTNCNFLKIISFLEKFASFTEDDKAKFLETIVDRLRLIAPDLLAAKLIPRLLTSRVLMLHSKADRLLLPYLFTPVATETVEQPLLDERLFTIHIIPIICKLYCVHKVQVRMILLRYLPSYAAYLPKDSLKEVLLPQILLGLKDENDDLVAATFNGISHLVTVFGGETILGKRRKIFHNVIPKKYSLNKITPEKEKFESATVLMVPRSEPDGVEALDTSSSKYDAMRSETGEEWQDWEQEDIPSEPHTDTSKTIESNKPQNNLNSQHNGKRKSFEDLDIKSLTINLPHKDEVDLIFGAMEPKFSKAVLFEAQKASINNHSSQNVKHSSKFDIQSDDVTAESGWSEEGWD
ncbi:protein-associating with the carboxyl-terminal domain of ezrin-like isoform X1 [Dinothrombium tinctorium]|uniref:Protein-associating with the carboxyl-terminal domain of ezrin-like isoform X1 n=1 Tax=Dinothrombium tinctorium TaxID=1965070 RepID=A0A3S3PFR0_9ACAR|nr:protein-associating with the carboxyl-terminal domain of ezrin-like isoform X1 [Dinothrombium tinctorium]RWS08761.1 protein-associating with the carboxyl-terminal domain of ezrin-like isoform X1 [Dinothrombium tinctorium]